MDRIDNESRRTIKTARKYGLVPGTTKCDIFQYFDEGFSPKEVRFLIGKTLMVDTRETRKTLANTIRRYYYDWENAQRRKKQSNP